MRPYMLAGGQRNGTLLSSSISNCRKSPDSLCLDMCNPFTPQADGKYTPAHTPTVYLSTVYLLMGVDETLPQHHVVGRGRERQRAQVAGAGDRRRSKGHSQVDLVKGERAIAQEETHGRVARLELLAQLLQ